MHAVRPGGQRHIDPFVDDQPRARAGDGESNGPCQRQQRAILEPALAHLNDVDTRTRRGCR